MRFAAHARGTSSLRGSVRRVTARTGACLVIQLATQYYSDTVRTDTSTPSTAFSSASSKTALTQATAQRDHQGFQISSGTAAGRRWARRSCPHRTAGIRRCACSASGPSRRTGSGLGISSRTTACPCARLRSTSRRVASSTRSRDTSRRCSACSLRSFALRMSGLSRS